MPRELRKRGRKKPKLQDEERGVKPQESKPSVSFSEVDPSSRMYTNLPAGPSSQTDLEAPFGYVDADVKAYFRTIDSRLKAWHDGEEGYDYTGGASSLEERKAIIVAAMSEMSGKELQLSTDPNCSVILERLWHSMDDLLRRSFMERLAGSRILLAKHRCASHVLQTAFELTSHTITREQCGNTLKVTSSEELGNIKSMTDLFLETAEEIMASLSDLIMHPFSSHVIRSILTVLVPSLHGENVHAGHGSKTRSKKSMSFKQRQDVMKSIIPGLDESPSTLHKVPVSFTEMAGRYVETLRKSLGDNEVRALASNKVASPVLQMIITIESKRKESEVSDSFMDRVLSGMISRLLNNDQSISREDYVEALLRDAASSHLFEVLIEAAPTRVFRQIWTTYFVGRLDRLLIHPVVNFVVAKAVSRLEDEDDIRGLLAEVKTGWTKAITSGRISVLRALVDRSANLGRLEQQVIETVVSSFGITDENDKKLIVPCILRLKTLETYQVAQNKPDDDESASKQHPEHNMKGKSNSAMFSTQGALLLQSLLRLHDPFNASILTSLQAQPMDAMLEMACDPTASRVLDVVLEGQTVPQRAKQKLVLSFLGHYHVLVDDRLGSRVADRCWAASDPHLKEQIAWSLMPHRQLLAGSIYGKYFARNLHLDLLQRAPGRWASLQANVASNNATQSVSAIQPCALDNKQGQDEAASLVTTPKKRKRGNDIDEIFASKGRRWSKP